MKLLPPLKNCRECPHRKCMVPIGHVVGQMACGKMEPWRIFSTEDTKSDFPKWCPLEDKP